MEINTAQRSNAASTGRTWNTAQRSKYSMEMNTAHRVQHGAQHSTAAQRVQHGALHSTAAQRVQHSEYSTELYTAQQHSEYSTELYTAQRVQHRDDHSAAAQRGPHGLVVIHPPTEEIALPVLAPSLDCIIGFEGSPRRSSLQTWLRCGSAQLKW